MTSALALNLLSSLLAFLLGALARGLYARWRSIGPARRFWRVQSSEQVVIVQSDGPGGDTPLPTLYEGDAMAAATVDHYLSTALGVRTIRIERSKTFSLRRDADSHLVVIGGPNANDFYKRLDGRLEMPYAFELFPRSANLIRLSDNRKLAQEIEEEKTVRDFAVISFLPNPFSPSRRLVILAGCGTMGTYAAAKMVTSTGIRETAGCCRADTPVSVVIEVEIVDGHMTVPRIVETTPWEPEDT
ncbi:hypothetical protein [Actinocorallia aurantiaca]|uniref:Uncharacterized protein n=1 Tax=Actinocorallia aurantiaca TaxID=46204 RepID=A0ABN3U8T0_9ACTN